MKRKSFWEEYSYAKTKSEKVKVANKYKPQKITITRNKKGDITYIKKFSKAILKKIKNKRK